MTTLITPTSNLPNRNNTLAEIQSHLTQLIGEPFRLARISYGDELTLHFGNLTPAKSPKLKGYLYGDYILGVRCSSWVLKSNSPTQMLVSGADWESLLSEASTGRVVNKEELEANPLIQPESRIVSIVAFVVQPLAAFGLQLRFSDASTLVVLPQSDDAISQELPLADWELLSPLGLLRVGPGLVAGFDLSEST